MAVRYLRSTDGNDADDGSTWALAKATLVGAFAASAAGDTVYVSQVHAETQASTMTLLSPGTAANPVNVICVNDGAAPPAALATTATVTTTGSFTINITTGFTYYYGIIFRGSTSGTQGNMNIGHNQIAAFGHYLKDCSIGSGAGITSSAFINIGASTSNIDDQFVTLDNTTIYTVNVAQNVALVGGRIVWKNTASAVIGTASPTTYFLPTNSGQLDFQVVGIDLSALGSGKTLINMARACSGKIRFRNCKLGASVTRTTGSIVGQGGLIVEFVNCDSADTNYNYWYQDYAGSIEHETVIVRTGGATDGTTPISREMISSANAKLFYPLVLSDLVVWNETTGSTVTLTVHIVTDNVTLTDQEIWLEVDYLGTSGVPLASLADDADNITDRLLGGSATAQTTSTETWTTTGIGTPVKQQLEVTVTPQEKGPIRCRVVLAKTSTTVWVCPRVECDSVTEGRMYQAGAQMYVIEPTTSGGVSMISGRRNMMIGR